MGSNNVFLNLDGQTINDVRFIHLEKKAYHGDDVKSSYQNNNSNKINFPNEEIGFYSFGFFDSVKCIRPTDSSCLFNFRHHFAISYPYERGKYIKKVEQWFGLIPLDKKYQWGQAKNNDYSDIFFYNDDKQKQMKMPFVGIILISLNSYTKKGMSRCFEEFDYALKRYADCMDKDIKSNKVFDGDFAARLYLTLNCADLCMAVRTDNLMDIHALNLQIQTTALENKYIINTTVMFMAQVTGIKNYSEVYKYNTGNNDIKFIVRSDKRYDDSSNLDENFSHGVNGNGRYVTKLKYDQYMELFFMQCKHCIEELMPSDAIGPVIESDKIKYVESICHEREWFVNDSTLNAQAEYISNRQGELLQENDEIALISYDQMRGIVYKVEETAKENLSYYHQTFSGYVRLVRELLDTYSDLWYQHVSPSGYIFYSQLYIALNGIQDELEKLESIKDEKNKMNRCKEIINMLQHIVGDINGYNKQLQFLNQDSVYYPSYEIQSKVNAEKYIIAYCSFLHLIFAKYYYDKDEKGLSKIDNNKDISYQSFPIAFLDIDSSDIETTFFFNPGFVQNLTKEEKSQKRTLVSVHFPSYSYFSDVWTVVPLLTHEVCHSHHYGNIEDRNNAVIAYIRNIMSQLLTSKMLSVSNKGFIANGMTPLANLIEKTFNKSIEEMWERAFDKNNGAIDVSTLRIDQLIYVTKIFYTCIFANKDGGVNKISYSDASQLQENAKNKLKDILELFDFRILPKYTEPNSFAPEETIFRCWLGALSCLVNLESEEIGDIIENENKYLNDVENKDIDIHYSEMSDVAKDFIEIYSSVKTRNIDEDKIQNYIDSNFQSAQKLLQLGTYLLASRYSKGIFESVALNKRDCEFRNQEDISEYLCKELTYNITTPIERYYKKCEEVFNKLCRNLERNTERAKQAEHLIVQCVGEYINFSNSVFYIKGYIEYLINSNVDYLIVDNPIGEFAEIFHSNGYETIKNIQKVGSSFCKNGFAATSIFEKTNREDLMSLGLLADKSDITKDLLVDMISRISEDNLNCFINDKIGIYKEIYADCGMCSAMQFTAFGHMMFCSYIYFSMSKKSDLSLDETNSLIERIKGISYIYFNKDYPKAEEEKRNFRKKFFNFELLEDITAFLTDVYENIELTDVKHCLEEFKNKRLVPETDIFDYTFNDEIRYWSNHIVSPLLEEMKNALHKAPDSYKKVIGDNNTSAYKCEQISIYAYSYLECIKYLADSLYEGNILYSAHRHSEFGDYFCSLKKEKMDNSDWVKSVQEYNSIQAIGKYYNFEVTKRPHKTLLESAFEDYAEGFAKHYEFVFKFYCKYRSAYGHVIETSDSADPIYKWFDLIDEYYEKGRK